MNILKFILKNQQYNWYGLVLHSYVKYTWNDMNNNFVLTKLQNINISNNLLQYSEYIKIKNNQTSYVDADTFPPNPVQFVWTNFPGLSRSSYVCAPK